MNSSTSGLYKIFLQYPDIRIDSRKINKNCIFFSLKGPNFNGNEFAAAALKNGAAYAVIDEKKFKTNNRLILVDNVLKSLSELATLHRKNLKIPFIGITGTNGKTTTKELLTKVLSKKFRVAATAGNLNNHIGVPLTVLSIKSDTEIAVVEMGANHVGEIKSLCKIARPNYGIITNIGKAHLEGFGGFENVIKAKTELYDFIKSSGGLVFLNSGNEILVKNSSGIKRIFYGSDKNCKISGQIREVFPCLTLDVNFDNKQILIRTSLYGEYNFENILAASCLGWYFGVAPEKVKEAIEEYCPENNRSQLIHTEKNKIILDAYNANPTSMEAAISNFIKMPETEKIVIAGDMLELGKESAKEHKKIIKLLKTGCFKKVFLIGEDFSHQKKEAGFESFSNIKEAVEWFGKNEIENSTILLKGSRRIELEKLADYL